MMVRLSAHYGHGAVKLFGEEKTYQFMRESHPRQRHHGVGPCICYCVLGICEKEIAVEKGWLNEVSETDTEGGNFRDK